MLRHLATLRIKKRKAAHFKGGGYQSSFHLSLWKPIWQSSDVRICTDFVSDYDVLPGVSDAPIA